MHSSRNSLAAFALDEVCGGAERRLTARAFGEEAAVGSLGGYAVGEYVPSAPEVLHFRVEAARSDAAYRELHENYYNRRGEFASWMPETIERMSNHQDHVRARNAWTARENVRIDNRFSDAVTELQATRHAAHDGLQRAWVPEPTPAGRAAARGALALGAIGLADTLSQDGVLPQAVGDAVRPINDVVGTALAPFDITPKNVHSTLADATGSQTAGFLAGAALNYGGYFAASAVAGWPGAATLGAASAINYAANHSDFAAAGRSSVEAMRDLGIDTDAGTFGHDLATEFRSGTSGLTANVPETERALDTFGQLYESQRASGANLELRGNGYGADSAAAQDRLIDLKDIALQEARSPDVTSGAVFFPDGTSGHWENKDVEPTESVTELP